MRNLESPRSRRKLRRWSATAGGTRLSKVKCLLIGDRNVVDALPPDSPRRRVTLPTVRFLLDEEASS